MLRYYLLILITLFTHICYASDVNNSTPFDYFVNSFIVRLIVQGGYFSIAAIIICSLLSYKFEKFREIFLSVVIAVLGIFLIIFLYESIQNFQWLPK